MLCYVGLGARIAGLLLRQTLRRGEQSAHLYLKRRGQPEYGREEPFLEPEQWEVHVESFSRGIMDGGAAKSSVLPAAWSLTTGRLRYGTIWNRPRLITGLRCKDNDLPERRKLSDRFASCAQAERGHVTTLSISVTALVGAIPRIQVCPGLAVVLAKEHRERSPVMAGQDVE